MHKMLKKLIACALVLSMLPFGSLVAMSEGNEATGTEVVAEDTSTDAEADAEVADETTEEESEEETDPIVAPITDEEAAALCQIAAENDRFILYYDEEQERVGFYDKEADYYWWATGVNAESDASIKEALRLNQKANVIVRYGDLEAKTTRNYMYSYKESTDKGKTTYKKINNGLEITFSYGTNFKVPITYTLGEDGKSFKVACDTTQIYEKDTSTLTGKVLTVMQMAPMMGAATTEDEGYIIVPDGSGAVIELNNGKQIYPEYSQTLYGRDLTPVPLTAPKVTEQAYLPTMSMVKGENGLVSIVTEGAAVATAKANVSYQGGSAYNQMYYEFTLRNTDNFYLAGDVNAIRVYEKNGIKVPKLEITYYPVKASNGTEVTYTECAEVFRNYLIDTYQLTKKTEADTLPMYVDIFGGVVKQRSILGIPFDLKTEMTSFDEATEIIQLLKDRGVEDFVVNYNDWTNDSMAGKIATKAKPSSILGGKGDYNDMLESFTANNVEYYPTLDNITFNKSSFGFMTLTDTAIRVSNAYSRQSTYSQAYGIPDSAVAPALLSPSSYGDVFEKILSSFSKKGYSSVSFGSYSDTVVSDFSKRSSVNRTETVNTIIDGYTQAQAEIGSILADGANDYILPLVNHVTNVPLSSSGYNITDYDIPFYQMVIHGYVPYSSRALNESADSEKLYLLAMASGTAIHYDFIYEESSEVVDTDYDTLFYANYKGWLDTASGEYALASEIIKSVSDQTITDYVIDGDVITTTYSNGYKTVVNLENATIEANGRTYKLSDYAEGGLAG